MTAGELVAQIRARGVRLEPRGADLWLSESIPPLLLEGVREHKGEVHFLSLSEELSRLRRLGNLTPEQTQRRADLEQIEDGYRQSGLFAWYAEGWLLLRSSLFGETILATRDDRVDVPVAMRGLARYSVAEARLLEGLSEEQVRRVHRVKKIFAGQLIEIGPPAHAAENLEGEEGSAMQETKLEARRVDGARIKQAEAGHVF